MFHFYSQLKPTATLIDGRMIGWDKVAITVGVLGSITALLYLAAVMIFRKRELAMYSGQ
jgi:hypothetical protein